MKYLLGICSLSLSLLTPPAVAAEKPTEILMVQSEVFQPKKARTNQTVTTLKTTSATGSSYLGRNSRPITMELGSPTDAELKKLESNNSRFKALQVGINREVPELPIVADWVWTPVNGGQAGQFLIVSEQASRLRALLQVQTALPAGVEIRIYSPDDDGIVHGPFTQDNFASSTNDDGLNQLWTPTLKGSTIGIEVFAPDNIDPADIKLVIPAISHILYKLENGTFKDTSPLKLNSCDVSIACAPQEWEETAKAVARYVYTASDGNSYLCSGTLLTDQDSSSQIPYFITANHCIDDSASAASMDFFWFFRESSCGANDATPIQISGGATLLVNRGELDTTLVRMNNAPPAGVTMSGWLLESFQNNDTVTGIHHALGDIKQYSSGKFNAYASITLSSNGYTSIADPQGDFTRVIWDQGITAPGSSGSGLWKTVNSQHFLKGTLVGGSSSCAATTAPDEYSRIERFYPFVQNWLGTKEPLSSFLTGQGELQALTDGILLARYMDGIRGTALLDGVTESSPDLPDLESRLQSTVAQLDIDQNGAVESGRDGLLLLRYLLGLRGNSLITGIDLTASPNNTAGAVTDVIENLLAGH